MKSEVGAPHNAHLAATKQGVAEDERTEKELAGDLQATGSLESFGDPADQEASTLNLIFTMVNPGTSGLSTSLKVIEKFEACIYHIETRPVRWIKHMGDGLECFVKCDIKNSVISSLLASLKRVADDVKIASEERVSSFPRKLQDLDLCHHLIIKFEPNFDQDHPGFVDQEYKKRRAYFAELAFTYKQGDLLPRIDYTAEETATWRKVYRSLINLYPNYACKQYLDSFQQLEKYCGFTEDAIPQLQDVSQFLKERTGFTLRPAAGLLSARDFLACLAFRVFPSTQYIRHHSASMHSPEPDCCHELLGHIPMLADKEFAQFSQDIGLASLGASDKDIDKLATLYWFTVEFGLCKQNGSIKAYGAGLLSSYGELMYAFSNKPVLKPFDPDVTAIQSYQDTSFQPIYFVSENFEDSKVKLRHYAMKMKKPFSLRYDPFTCSIEVLDSLQKVKNMLGQINDNLKSLYFALDKVC
ncbi:tyrosine 3-monooxygenase-like [Spea bombifrons]|uniref:tyrosine 3-monooxygenase-like n=1 Tax=Spea bombifrons TaxID=233779 RepID=UPI002349FFBB|nr:tyrosine 3-monooxygenase-like [Spea bombifrons]